MKLSHIEKDPMNSYDYMERLVNDGSDSGFTDIHNTSKQTDPRYATEFRVKELYPIKGEILPKGVCVDTDFMSSKDQLIYVHPDWIDDPEMDLDQKKLILTIGNIREGMLVAPTSSSRTVWVKGTNKFLKLHYPGMIGRIQRDLGEQHLSVAVEITRILNELKQKDKNFPLIFDFMPEYYGRVLKYKKEDNRNGEIGFVCREMPKYDGKNYYIPAFSLFAKDSNKLDDEKLFVQILKKHSDDPLSFLLYEICFPLIDIFFYCAFNIGLIPEMHSQNIVFVFDADWKTKKILLRDFESIDVDITIREKLGFKERLSCPSNKAISNDNKDYKKRHSFMFDHKLCEYLIDHLVECATTFINCNNDEITHSIQKYCKEKHGEQSKGFFPEDGCWYKYPNIEIDRSTSERPYKSQGKAKYR